MTGKLIGRPSASYRRATRRVRRGPDFVILGAQKAGTTSLFRYLTRHPSVLPPAGKELDFFTDHYDRGPLWYRQHFPTVFERGAARVRSGSTVITGEASPYYLFHPLAPSRLHRHCSTARLIILLRHPVDRAISHYHHSLRSGHEDLPLADAIAAEPARLEGEVERLCNDGSYRSYHHRRHSYVARGLYDGQIEAWLRYFPREQFHIVKSESLFDDPMPTYLTVLRFLGLPPWAPSAFPAHNRGASRTGLEPAAIQQLGLRFEASVSRLQELLGADFGWDLT